VIRTALLTLLCASPALAAPLKLWHAYRGGEEQALQQLAREFTAKTQIDVELLAVPYDAFSSKITSAIPHDAGPDVFIFAHERLRQFVRLGVVAPSQLPTHAAEYLKPAVDALEVDGVHYGWPLSLKCLALFYNRKLVSEPPRTTDELQKLLPTLSNAEENRFGLAYEAGDFYFHAPILFGFGGQLFGPDGRSQFNTPQMARSLSFIKQLQDARWMPQEASGALVKSLFNDNRAALAISGPWFAGEIDPGIDYAIAPLPMVSETSLPMQPFLGVEAAFVSARSAQGEQAQALAQFLADGPGAVTRVVLGRQIPAALAAYDAPQVKSDPLISSFREAALSARPTPNTLEMTRVWEPMKLTLRAVLQGLSTPAEAGALAERRYSALNRTAPDSASPFPYYLFAGLAVCGSGAWAWRRRRREPFKRRYPEAARGLLYVAPAAAGLLVLVAIPFAVGISLSLFHHDAGNYRFVGLGNFTDILASRGYSITEPLSFYFTLAVTLAWTLVNVVLHVSLGLALALLLKSPLLRLRGVFRVLLIVPWAVPNYITALMWKGMFHQQFGAINALLQTVGIQPVSWFTHFSTSFAANVCTNTWLGFPFMMVVSLGALQSIPQDLYEAAEVDGASKWVQFRRITLPLLKPALLPAVILGSVWSFNMFNVIYLVSGGEPGGATDILVSEAYRWAFQRNEQYGFAAAYSVLIFVVLLLWSSVTNRIAREEKA
jgi:arabinogalactan oligomer/maltooligosaccharide transport system permease protein